MVVPRRIISINRNINTEKNVVVMIQQSKISLDTKINVKLIPEKQNLQLDTNIDETTF